MVPSGAERHVLRRHYLVPIPYGQHRLTACIAPLAKTHRRLHPRIGHCPRRHIHILQLNIVFRLFFSKPHRMDRQATVPQRVDRLEIHSASRFSPPSLSKTTAPTGRSAVSAASCFSPSLMWVAVASAAYRLPSRPARFRHPADRLGFGSASASLQASPSFNDRVAAASRVVLPSSAAICNRHAS